MGRWQPLAKQATVASNGGGDPSLPKHHAVLAVAAVATAVATAAVTAVAAVAGWPTTASGGGWNVTIAPRVTAAVLAMSSVSPTASVGAMDADGMSRGSAR